MFILSNYVYSVNIIIQLKRYSRLPKANSLY